MSSNSGLLSAAPRARDSGRSRGQALPEFALVFIPLMLLLLGIFDLGRAVYAYNTITDAARSGARTAIVNQACDPIVTAARTQALALGITASEVAVNFNDGQSTLSPPPSVGGCGSTVKIGDIAEVSVSYTFTAVTPLIGNVSMSAKTQIPVEYPCLSGCLRPSS